MRKIESHKDPEDLFDKFFSDLAGWTAPDAKSLGILECSLNSLEQLCDTIGEHKESLSKIKKLMKTTFEPSSDDSESSSTLGFFRTVHYEFSRLLIEYVNKYESLERDFNVKLRGRELDFRRYKTSKESMHSLLEITHNLPHMMSRANNHLGKIALSLPEILKQTSKVATTYNKYLVRRFVKSPEDPPEPQSQRVMIISPEEDNEVKYVKIKLIHENPVLTDFLLDIIDEIIPPYRERLEKKGKRYKVVRELDSFRVKNAASELMNIAHPHLLGYVQKPEKFFLDIGNALENFYQIFKALLPYHQEILRSPFVEPSDGESIEEKLSEEHLAKITRGIKRMKHAHLEAIVQKEEDYLPEHRRETDHFELREKLLMLLYEALNKLGKMKDEEQKECYAEKTIIESMDSKAKIDELLHSIAERRLRKNLREENEYYEGRQGHIGSFSFERRPTPKVKVEEVIGKSFDRAKEHIMDILETGKYPHIMNLSAPGGKVRSNILLIGPYGCGKTELARAICADQRVIGASVGVTDTQTAYMHESVNNVRRVYDAAKELYEEGRELKPVVLVLDEFNSWFARSDRGSYSDIDLKQIETTLLEILDGMRDYNGIVTIAMTNKPMEIPKGIVRRFRYVDVVGQLAQEERAHILKMYLERTLPIHPAISEQHYLQWAKHLEDATGDVARKVVDELHFSLVPEYIKKYPGKSDRIERILQKREVKSGENNQRDIIYLKNKLARFKKITPLDVDNAIKLLLEQPPIRMQIETARQVYEEANKLLEEISQGGYRGFGGLKKEREYFGD